MKDANRMYRGEPVRVISRSPFSLASLAHQDGTLEEAWHLMHPVVAHQLPQPVGPFHKAQPVHGPGPVEWVIAVFDDGKARPVQTEELEDLAIA